MGSFYPAGNTFPDYLIRVKKASTCNVERGDRPKILAFSGLASVDGVLVDSEDRLGATPSFRHHGQLPTYGCFFTVVARAGEVLILNDLFGLCPIYLAHFDTGCLISNRSHLIAIAMSIMHIKRQPDIETIWTQLSSNHRLFLHPYSRNTVLDGLRICRADSYLRISDNGTVSEVLKPEFKVGNHGRVAYQELIQRGAEEIAQNVRAAVRSKRFNHRILDLSGGRDSRITFASAFRNGQLHSCHTRVEKTDYANDFELGAVISNQFGAQLDTGDGHPRFSKGSAFVLGFWRSAKAGVHHRVGASNWPTLWGNTKTVRLNGGCGEVYRDLWREEHILDEVRSAASFDNMCIPPWSRAARHVARQSLLRAFSMEKGETLEDRVGNHYVSFLNRFHFGLPYYNEWYGYIPFSPLQSSALFAASRLLTAESRTHATVLTDITQLLAPALASFPYAGKNRSASVPNGFAAHLDTDATRVAIRACEYAASARTESHHAASHQVDTLESNQTIAHVLRDQGMRALDRIREAVPDLRSSLDTQFDRYYDYLWQSSMRHAMALASKLLSVFDLCLDDASDMVSPEDSGARTTSLNASLRLKAHYGLAEIWGIDTEADRKPERTNSDKPDARVRFDDSS
ncbi:hypothetical protein [Paraburkholderia fynbosensis]|uniref:Asparagine synthetase domain-containing protein n=1 Tax=Paraburkholderia fynbosensis TaxID=1200993 RepID=A0A6J5GRW8_9BURK|nr:hypothetical protein [Paraburkholderia fynbosensis]CAB3804576.1 hypothetical protein LMG27177_05681 [Paraburkholderia fynbosensis]